MPRPKNKAVPRPKNKAVPRPKNQIHIDYTLMKTSDNSCIIIVLTEPCTRAVQQLAGVRRGCARGYRPRHTRIMQHASSIKHHAPCTTHHAARIKHQAPRTMQQAQRIMHDPHKPHRCQSAIRHQPSAIKHGLLHKRIHSPPARALLVRTWQARIKVVSLSWSIQCIRPMMRRDVNTHHE